jgi:hypothetical protein
MMQNIFGAIKGLVVTNLPSELYFCLSLESKYIFNITAPVTPKLGVVKIEIKGFLAPYIDEISPLETLLFWRSLYLCSFVGFFAVVSSILSFVLGLYLIKHHT